jgi:hypothetical protein
MCPKDSKKQNPSLAKSAHQGSFLKSDRAREWAMEDARESVEVLRKVEAWDLLADLTKGWTTEELDGAGLTNEDLDQLRRHTLARGAGESDKDNTPLKHSQSVLRRMSSAPTWIKVSAFLAVFSFLQGLWCSWGQPEFLRELALCTAAFGVYYFSGGAAIWAGIAAGSRVPTQSDIPKWLVGVLVFLVVGVALTAVGYQIPEIGWRLNEIFDAESVIEDWV